MLVTVVDVFKYQMYLANFGEFFEDQVVNAATVVLSRTQKAPAEKLEAVVSSIRRLNGGANIVTTPWDSLRAEQIIAVAEKHQSASLENRLTMPDKADLEEQAQGGDCKCGSKHEHTHHGRDCGYESHHAHGCDAGDVFEVWSVETPGRFGETELEEMLDKLADAKAYGTVLRGKGIMQKPEGQWLQFDYVPGEIRIGGAEADYTGRLAVIGSSLNRKELCRLFRVEDCRVHLPSPK